MSDIIAPARNYCQNMHTQKKRTLLGAVEDQPRETCCGLCCKSFQHQETGCGLYQRFFQPSVFVHKENHSYDGKEIGKLFLPILRMKEPCQQRSPKWSQERCRHYDQDERQPDATLHWDTIRPALLKAFAKTCSTRFLRRRLASTHP